MHSLSKLVLPQREERRLPLTPGVPAPTIPSPGSRRSGSTGAVSLGGRCLEKGQGTLLCAQCLGNGLGEHHTLSQKGSTLTMLATPSHPLPQILEGAQDPGNTRTTEDSPKPPGHQQAFGWAQRSKQCRQLPAATPPAQRARKGQGGRGEHRDGDTAPQAGLTGLWVRERESEGLGLASSSAEGV